MPHDKFGKPVEVGDEVIVRFKVVNIYGGYVGDTTCNCNLESVELMEGKRPTSLAAINTKQTEKVKANEENELDTKEANREGQAREES